MNSKTCPDVSFLGVGVKTHNSNICVQNLPYLQADALSRFINETSWTQANYQYVVIKTLLENGLSATKDQILEKIEYYNSDKVPQKYRENGVFAVLQKKLVITATQKGIYDLNLAKDTDSKNILKLISDCNKKIWQDKLSSPDIFIALGPWENWDYTIKHLPLRWGVSDTTRSNIDVYKKLKEGDIVFYYPTQAKPKFFEKSGFFGVGVVARKENKRTEPYWPIEIKNNRLFFTHELYLDTLVFVDEDDELLRNVDGLPLIKNLNHVNPGSSLNNLLLNMKNKWNISLNPTLSEDVKHWKIAPGKNAKNWESQKNQKIIGIGWNELGDLTGLTKEQISQRVSDKFQSARAVILSQFEHFLKIKKGDIVIANKGKSKIVGIGRVIGDYRYASEQEYVHTYPVDWFWTGEKEIPFQDNWFVTVIPVPIELYKIIVSPKQLLKINLSPEIEELIEAFDKNPKDFEISNWTWMEREDREKYYERFVTKFPAEKIGNLTIEQYVLGILDDEKKPNQESFSYYLEREAPTTGNIKGSVSMKFGIYYDRKKQKDFIYSESYSNENDAFNAVKHEITTILSAGKKYIDYKDSEKLSDIVDAKDQNIHRHIRSKILSTYYPDSFLSIHSRKKIDLLLDYFDIPKVELEEKLTMKQLKLLDIKDRHPIMRNWDAWTYSYFLFAVILVKKELPIPSSKNLIELKKQLAKVLLIKDDKLEEIISALLTGKSVLLTGAVGTGKTHLAKILPEIAWKDHDGGYYSSIVTATSDWTTTDVIGGIHPKVDDAGKITYEIQKGCVANTVSLNWKEGTNKSITRDSFEGLNAEENLHKFKGVWLVIDEFNRANIDKAFGQMFTALEYKKMQIPTIDSKKAFEELIIPEDYRIIGTLNTADKHYLHSLSDALKRRFSIIEIPIPEYSQKDKELYFVISKAIKNLDIPVNLELSHEQKIFVRGKGDSEIEKIIDTLYTLMSFIREIKPLGTALLISMLRFMIVNHSLELVKKENWNSSLDSALVTTIIPQIEDLNYWTLKVIRAALSGKLEDFFENDPEIKDDGHEKYKKDFQKMVNCIRKIKGEKSNKIIKRFMDGKLGLDKKRKDDGTEIPDKDIEYLKIWNAENVGQKPFLPKFLAAINQIISEKGINEEIEE